MTSPEVLATELGSWAGEFADRGASFGMGLDVVFFLMALRIDHERTLPPFDLPYVAPDEHAWPSLLGHSGPEVIARLAAASQALAGSQTTLGMLARLQAVPDEPAHLRALIGKIDHPEELVGGPWTAALDTLAAAVDHMLVDAGNDGDIPLLPTNRHLCEALAGVLAPETTDSVYDVAAGSGGLLLAARSAAVAGTTNRSDLRRLRDKGVVARELRPDLARWCTFNLLLHGIGTLEGAPIVEVGDSLAAPTPAVASVVLTNPEFGRQDAGLAATLTAGSRSDISITGNRQLDMLQHVISMLKPGGRAAVVLPDNVLFEGGAGATVRKRLLDSCDLHTILRLPTGISRKGGVKANVLFFTKQPAREEPWTTETWFYDLRTNQHFTLKRNKLTREHLQPFVDAYSAEDRSQRVESDRFKRFAYDELVGRDQTNLDITWLKDDSHVDADDLPDPDVLARELADELHGAAELMDQLAEELEDAR